MKAIKLAEPWRVQCVEVPAPSPGEGDALIRVRAAGICGSDIGAFRGENPLVSYPRIVGHELAGEIVSIPENPRGLRPGDRVVVDPYLYCGRCYPCGLGRTNCCEQLRVLGVHVDGGMSEYCVHPADMLWRLPDSIPWEIAPIAEPLTIALHGLHRAGLQSGEHIVIYGAGPIGMLVAMSARYYGAVPILIDPVEKRLEMARSLGVDHTINPAQQDVAALVREYTGGRMAEVVLEASGANSAIVDTLNVVSYAGRVVLTGWPKRDTAIDTGAITKKEIDLRGARTSAREFEEAIRLIERGEVDVRAILTEVVPLAEAPAAIAGIHRDPGNFMKVNVLC